MKFLFYLIQLLLNFLQCICPFFFKTQVGFGTGLGGVPYHYHGNIILHILASKLGIKFYYFIVDDF